MQTPKLEFLGHIREAHFPIVVPDNFKSGNITESYHRLYRYKYVDWLERNIRMKWTNRQIPEFMQDLEYLIL